MNFKAYSILIVFIVIVLQSCKPYQDISVSSIEGMHISKLSKEGIEAEVKVKIKNPNTIGFAIYPSKFDVTFTGIRLGEAKLNKRVRIASKTEKVYSFYLKSSLSDLNILDIPKLLNMDNLGKIEVKGDLKVGKMLVKKSYPVVYNDKVKIFK